MKMDIIQIVLDINDNLLKKPQVLQGFISFLAQQVGKYPRNQGTNFILYGPDRDAPGLKTCRDGIILWLLQYFCEFLCASDIHIISRYGHKGENKIIYGYAADRKMITGRISLSCPS